MRTLYITTLLATLSIATTVRAEPAAPRRFTLGVLVGLGAQSEYHDGPVRFSDGDVDFLSVDPGPSLQLGLSAAYLFGERLAGNLTLWYGNSDANYIENDNFRPDLEVSTTAIDLGVTYQIVSTRKVRFAAGGGLTLAFQSVDRMVWDDNLIEPSTSAIGLHGLGVLDVPLTERVAFRALLRLGLSSPQLGDLEDELARAEGEAGADAEGDSRTDVMLAAGVAIGL
jgi:hypothetical protein